jgi:hypothetical protein
MYHICSIFAAIQLTIHHENQLFFLSRRIGVAFLR